ncbi:hypothetical protein [Bradyrhizobium jicamae]|nr:hypothetical protein [Bradyrhizobium jicamae]
MMVGSYFEESEVGQEFERTMANQGGGVVTNCRRTGLILCKSKA